ncbi:nucleoside deaminase [Halalkalicoccus sp. NIPERK01]|uniref:nucleoside deaminase n=1 Tax=Halalkalicoccus sp. NIPERK01 TaxID=3053469 RepID=UPI00256EA177|nr:nucleoside deaminase [Halalkalicoccus sp. NIPERK01]MDL5361729.1 nucleoside deaminase [Halalkalicoccus sp. NIPERK01]
MSEKRFMRRAIELAREAAERGDNPFGSVLVHDGEIVMEDSNRVATEDDVRRHPELNLAHLAVREYDPEVREEMTMYTSTEPCPMCAGGMRYAAFERVVYATSGRDIAAFTGHEPGVRASEILDGVTEVEGPLHREEALALHESVW